MGMDGEEGEGKEWEKLRGRRGEIEREGKKGKEEEGG